MMHHSTFQITDESDASDIREAVRAFGFSKEVDLTASLLAMKARALGVIAAGLIRRQSHRAYLPGTFKGKWITADDISLPGSHTGIPGMGVEDG